MSLKFKVSLLGIQKITEIQKSLVDEKRALTDYLQYSGHLNISCIQGIMNQS